MAWLVIVNWPEGHYVCLLCGTPIIRRNAYGFWTLFLRVVAFSVAILLSYLVFFVFMYWNTFLLSCNLFLWTKSKLSWVVCLAFSQNQLGLWVRFFSRNRVGSWVLFSVETELSELGSTLGFLRIPLLRVLLLWTVILAKIPLASYIWLIKMNQFGSQFGFGHSM